MRSLVRLRYAPASSRCSPQPPSMLTRSECAHPAASSPTSRLRPGREGLAGLPRRVGDHAAASIDTGTGFPTARSRASTTIRAATPIPPGNAPFWSGPAERDGPTQYCRVHSDRRADV